MKQHFEKDWRQAIDGVLKQGEKEDVIVVTGSLYFLAMVRGMFVGALILKLERDTSKVGGYVYLEREIKKAAKFPAFGNVMK